MHATTSPFFFIWCSFSKITGHDYQSKVIVVIYLVTLLVSHAGLHFNHEQQLVNREKLLAITHSSKVIEKLCLGVVKVKNSGRILIYINIFPNYQSRKGGN